MKLFRKRSKVNDKEVAEEIKLNKRLSKNLEENAVSISDIFAPDGIQEDVDKLMIGRNYCRVFAISIYPRDIWVGWLDDIFALGDVDLSIHAEPLPTGIAIKRLGSKIEIAMSQLIIEQNHGYIGNLSKLRAIISDLQDAMEAIQTNTDRMFYATIIITLYAPSKEILEEKSKSLEDKLAGKSCQVRTMIFRQLEGYKSSIPLGNLTVYDYDRNLTTGGMASLFPISNPDISHTSGIYLGKNYFTGAPMFYDRFSPHLPNQHLAVFGFTGSGKSVTLKLIAARSVISGISTVVLDPEREYKDLITKLLGGQYVTIRAGRPAGINLLDLDPIYDEDSKQTLVDISEKIIDIRSIFSAIVRKYMGRPLTPLEITDLEEAVIELYREYGITQDPESLYEYRDQLDEKNYAVGKVKKVMPTLTNLVEKLSQKRNAKDLADILKPFCSGGTLGMFDCQTQIDFNTHVLGFDLKDIRDEFTKFYSMMVILSWIWNKFAQGNTSIYASDSASKRKSVVIDESWMFVKYPEAAEFLETLARRGRKYHTSMVVASQFIDEFLSREEGRAVINSCSTLILLKQHPNSVDRVVEAFHLASGCRKYLESFNPGECIILLNGSTTAVRIDPTVFEWNYVKTSNG